MSKSDDLDKPMAKGLLVHPFAFALFPVLSLFSQNVGQMLPEMLFAPAVTTLGLTALLFFTLQRLLRNRELAALATSWSCLFFFLYGPFSMGMLNIKFGDFVFARNIHRVPLYAALGLLLGYGVFVLYRRWRGFSQFLNVISISLLAVTLVSLGWQIVSGAGHRSPLFARTADAGTVSRMNESLPDIYYIILDGYGSAGVLSNHFSFDNGPFLKHLESKGFYLPRVARSNYGWTILSLSSSLGMDYLQDSYSKLPANEAQKFLETKGYEYVSLSTRNPPPRTPGRKWYSPRAWLFNEFSLQLLRTTLIEPVALRLHLYSEAIRQNLLSTLDVLCEVPELEGKKFVFAHILCPHPPYVFKANGENPGPLSEANLSVYQTPWDDKEAYIQQVRFINAKITEVVETLLRKSKVPPIIILQGDHGPKLTVADRRTRVDMHLHILNAYLLPGTGRSVLYDTITPVNTFRVIFNHYFQAKFPLLKDKCYFSAMESLFRFVDVTEQANQ